MRLHENIGDKSKEIITHQKLFKESSKCLLDYIEVKNIQQKKFSLTKSTSKQNELLQRVGLSNLINREIVEKANNNLIYAE
jgi:hypothetical protein